MLSATCMNIDAMCISAWEREREDFVNAPPFVNVRGVVRGSIRSIARAETVEDEREKNLLCKHRILREFAEIAFEVETPCD